MMHFANSVRIFSTFRPRTAPCFLSIQLVFLLRGQEARCYSRRVVLLNRVPPRGEARSRSAVKPQRERRQGREPGPKEEEEEEDLCAS